MHLSSQSQFGRLKISVGKQIFSTFTELVWCIAGAQPDIDPFIETPFHLVISVRWCEERSCDGIVQVLGFNEIRHDQKKRRAAWFQFSDRETHDPSRAGKSGYPRSEERRVGKDARSRVGGD